MLSIPWPVMIVCRLVSGTITDVSVALGRTAFGFTLDATSRCSPLGRVLVLPKTAANQLRDSMKRKVRLHNIILYPENLKSYYLMVCAMGYIGGDRGSRMPNKPCSDPQRSCGSALHLNAS